jgi:hypothetical protein
MANVEILWRNDTAATQHGGDRDSNSFVGTLFKIEYNILQFRISLLG